MTQIVPAILLVVFLAVAVLWVLVPAFYGLPPVSTHRKRIRRALVMANLQAGEKLFDLGSGHGRVLVLAAREFGARAVGIEIGPVQCVVSRVNARLNGVGSKVRVEAGDMFRADLSGADVVYAYLTSNFAYRLQEKLARELPGGARIVTIAFNLPDWQPADVDRENLIYLYIK